MMDPLFLLRHATEKNSHIEEYAKAVPISFTRVMIEHLSFHGDLSREEAESRLKQHNSNCYLTRYNASTHTHVLSVMATRKESTPVFQHFQININNAKGYNQYELDGSEEKFDAISKLLDFYQNKPVNYTITAGIGEPIQAESYKNLPTAKDDGSTKGSIGSQPTLEFLITHNVITQISSKWRNIGLRLGLGINALDTIDREAFHNNTHCCASVFNGWIKGGGNPPHYPCTWKGLLCLLSDIEHRAVAKNLERVLTKEGVQLT